MLCVQVAQIQDTTDTQTMRLKKWGCDYFGPYKGAFKIFETWMRLKGEMLIVDDNENLIIDLDLDHEFWQMEKHPKALWMKVNAYIRNMDIEEAIKQGGTGYAGVRLGEADHPGPPSDVRPEVRVPYT